jgi:hypothetical protein
MLDKQSHSNTCIHIEIINNTRGGIQVKIWERG